MIMNQVITKPSSLISEIKLKKVDQYCLFQFSDQLQEKMEQLLIKKKSDQLTSQEKIELENIGELDRIFTHINAMLLAQK
jgi:hypothetical protein